ncbi:hypothetical protein BDF22DRAFT_686726 [Syncephalis plumigaleata]|nr:hypothetical protein BDF22DRAFT_686726 [Syncephalis plumigaleata]
MHSLTELLVQARTHSQPPTMVGISGLNSQLCVWYFPTSVHHPLRDIVGSAPFYLLSNGDELNETRVDLLPMECIKVDLTASSTIIDNNNSSLSNHLYKTSTQWVWPNQNDTIIPLEYRTARSYLSRISERDHSSLEEAATVFAYCHTMDHTGMMLLGITRHPNHGFERKIDQIIERGSQQALETIQSILPRETKQVSNDGNHTLSSNSHITLEFTWQDTYDNVIGHEHHHRSSTSTDDWSWLRCHQMAGETSPLVLTVQMAPCTLEYEEDDLRRMLYRQIDQLAEWCQYAKMDTWHNTKKMNLALVERLEQFITYHQQQQQQQQPPIWDDTYNASLANQCRELDFTEQLWQLCQMVTDQEEIADAIYAILEQVRSGRIQPKIIRDATRLDTIDNAAKRYQQLSMITQAAEKCLATPLDCIISIGRMKLQQDYLYYYNQIDHELAQLLSMTLPLDNDNDDDVSNEKVIDYLRVSYRVLTLVQMLHAQLPSLSSNTMRLLVHGLFTHVTQEVPHNDRVTIRTNEAQQQHCHHTMTDWCLQTLRCQLVIARQSSIAQVLLGRLLMNDKCLPIRLRIASVSIDNKTDVDVHSDDTTIIYLAATTTNTANTSGHHESTPLKTSVFVVPHVLGNVSTLFHVDNKLNDTDNDGDTSTTDGLSTSTSLFYTFTQATQTIC